MILKNEIKSLVDDVINEVSPKLKLLGEDVRRAVGVYGHWIATDGEMIPVPYSHQVTAREIIEDYYIKRNKLSPEEVEQVSTPLCGVDETEKFLYNRGWLRGVNDRNYYYVNGKPNQRLTPKQQTTLVQFGMEYKVVVEYRTRGEDVYKGTETIYDPYEMLQESDGRPLKKSLKQSGYQWKYVTIFRAMESTEKELKDKDYVTRSQKFAVEHSDHMTSVKEELYHVMRYMVNSEHVFEAWNPGEYFYSGPSVKGVEVYRSEDFL
jgi:hypothetical protein